MLDQTKTEKKQQLISSLFNSKNKELDSIDFKSFHTNIQQTTKRDDYVLLLAAFATKKIVAFIVHDNKRWKILYLNFPDSFHAEFLKV